MWKFDFSSIWKNFGNFLGEGRACLYSISTVVWAGKRVSVPPHWPTNWDKSTNFAPKTVYSLYRDATLASQFVAENICKSIGEVAFHFYVGQTYSSANMDLFHSCMYYTRHTPTPRRPPCVAPYTWYFPVRTTKQNLKNLHVVKKILKNYFSEIILQCSRSDVTGA